MSRATNYGYTRKGALRHRYVSATLETYCAASYVDKAAKPPGPADRPELDCMRCEGVAHRAAQLKAMGAAGRRKLAPSMKRGAAWELVRRRRV